MRKMWFTTLILAVLLLPIPLRVPASPLASLPAAPPPPTPEVQPASPLEKAILDSALAHRDRVYPIPLFDIRVDNIQTSPDGSWASAWLVWLNPQSGEVVETEPGLALARWDGSGWQVSLPPDKDFRTQLAASPVAVVSDEYRQSWLALPTLDSLQQTTAPFTGYYLPWQAGMAVRLTNSTAHDAYITTGNAHYSYDFANGTMFNVHASRGGTVWAYKDTIPDNDPSAPNYLVLEDTSTSPTTYQLYLHLAQYSIPPELKVIGAPVVRGQFIARADDTGMSTGHHLHYQVQQAPHYDGYWGISLDFVFADVSINGGRPRRVEDQPYCTWPGDVCGQTAYTYISQNTVPLDPNAPWGDLTTPSSGYNLTSSTLNLSGWAADDTQVASAQFKAFYDGAWHAIGPLFTTSPFSYNWDVCADGVPAGPLSLALAIRDTGGTWAQGLPGLAHIANNAACVPPPPACTPASNQVALYAEPDYQGACLVLGSGDHASLGSLGTDNAASIQIGSSVAATLYDQSDWTGRGETFLANDANLAGNRIGANTVSSVRVASRTSLPGVPSPTWPLAGATYPADKESISLSWDNGGGGVKYQVELNGSLKDWAADHAYSLGSLAPGSYTWRVRAGNSAGSSNWSAGRSFTVTSPTTNVPTVSAPFSDNMESGATGWLNSSNWDQSTTHNHTSGGSVSWAYEVNSASSGYDNGQPNAGSLTTPPIALPGGGYMLRFWYRYETEAAIRQWDQRWVQISQDGGPFTNLLQLGDDPPNYWLQSPAIDLSAYANHTIRLRFYFVTLDQRYNAYQGWLIDDLSINQTVPPSCTAGNEPDNTHALATPLTFGSSVQGAICPGGDIDFFRFSAQAGDQIGVSALAKVDGSQLDTYLYLLDGDGDSLLAENDDLVYAQNTDSFIAYRLPRDGEYFLKLRAWNNPTAGGSTYDYTLRLNRDSTPPSVTLSNPPPNTFLPNGLLTLQVNTSDAESEISHVEFAWHPGDWAGSPWTTVGVDLDGSNGWSYTFDTSTLPDQQDIAFYARAYNQGGLMTGALAWNLWLDRTPPVSALSPLSGAPQSNAVYLGWSGSDNVSGLDHYDLQAQVNNGAWSDAQTNLPGTSNGTWFIGQAGASYGFRLRAVDRIGNTESYPTAAETTATLPNPLCSLPDAYENDNAPAEARDLSSPNTLQRHDFCNPIPGSGWAGDEDWYRLVLPAGERLFILAKVAGASSAPVLRLYAADASTLLASASPASIGQGASLSYTSPATGQVFLRITHLDARVAGPGTAYDVRVLRGLPLFLPILGNLP